MSCEDVRELLPAYALGALDAGEIESVEDHLRACREHDGELTELRATVFALDRYGEDADFAAPALQPDQPVAAAPVAVSPRAGWPPLAAAAVLVLLAFGAGWLAAGLFGGDAQQVSIFILGAGGQQLLLQDAGDAGVTVTMAGFTRLPEAQAYQIWAIRDGEWVRIGVCNTNEAGGWKGDFDFSIHEGEQIALTVEPAGGSAEPSSEPVLSSQF